MLLASPEGARRSTDSVCWFNPGGGGGGTKTSDPEGGKEKLGGNTTAENSENAEGERDERKTHLGCSSLQAPTINRGGDWDLIGQLSGEGE